MPPSPAAHGPSPLPATSFPQRRVTALWNWIPAFRAVAEVEHVQRTAARLHVTASSLSRSIRLLEEAVGHPLFDRTGRNLRLNDAGRAFLAAVRDGMRRIDDGVAEVTGTTFSGELRVGCEGDHPMTFAWAAATALLATHPDLVTQIEPLSGAAAGDLRVALATGRLDIGLVAESPHAPGMRIERLGAIDYGVYCGRAHPLFAARVRSFEALALHPFVAPIESASRGRMEPWPPEHPRRIALRLPALQPAIDACEDGRLLAVLPDRAVAAKVRAKRLRRFDALSLAPTALYCVRREPLGTTDRVSTFVAELTRILASSSSSSSRRPLRTRRGPSSSPAMR